MPTKRDNSQHQIIPDLTAGQLVAVDALIAGGTDQEAASAAGVHRSTLNAWKLHNPAFIAAMNARRTEIWESSRDRLRSLLPKALDRVARAIEDNEIPGGLRAAMRILEAAEMLKFGALEDTDRNDPEAIIASVALSLRPPRGPDDDVIEAVDGVRPITDQERRDAIRKLRDLGAFEDPRRPPDVYR